MSSIGSCPTCSRSSSRSSWTDPPPEPPAKRKTPPGRSARPSDATERLREGAREILGRPLQPDEIDQFGKYLELLTKWQRVHRLVGSVEPRSVVDDLFLDSLLFLKALPATVVDVLDLGAGAGFPGIPLRIVRPALRLTLVEARSRRASFLSAAVRELGLAGTRVFNARGEDLVENPGIRADVVVMRCAGSLDQIFPLAVGFLRPGGTAIAAGPPVPREAPGFEWRRVAWTGGTRNFAVILKPEV